MRAVFGILSLLAVVVIVGILAKKQLTSVTAPPAALGQPAVSGAAPQQQVQQFQQAVQGTLQQARPMSEDK